MVVSRSLCIGALLLPSLCLSPGLSAAEPSSTGSTVHQIKIQPDKAPDCSSLKSIIESITRDCKTNDEKAIAVYNFMQLTHYHQEYPSEPDGLGALKEINVYGWSLCGGLHTVEAALYRELGWPWRYVGWSNPGHTTVETQYDGRWHYLDVFLRFYAWKPDPNAPGGRTIAGQDDIRALPALVSEGLEFDRQRSVYYHKGNRFEVQGGKANWQAPSFLSCGDGPDGIITGVRSSNRAGSPTGWATINFDSPGYSTDVNLSPGMSLTQHWDAVPDAFWWNGGKKKPAHGCGDKDFRNCPAIGPILEPYEKEGGAARSFASGRLLFAPNLANAACLACFAGTENAKWAGGKLIPADAAKPASITVALQSPYVMSRATGTVEGADSVTLSTDGGKTFSPVDLADFSQGVGGKYACLVKVTFAKALSALRLEAIVQCNRGSLPYLSPGKNRVTVSLADAKQLGENRLVVTYAYRVGARNETYEEIAAAGAELARAHYASWNSQVIVVQKTFAAKDLPATFEIDIPTPAGKLPVYPRMLFVRREILAPGDSPLPVPAGALPPTTVRGEELKTLPNPFTIGCTPAPPRIVRPTTTQTFELHVSHAVALDGRTAANHFLKWKEGETWALLVAGNLDLKRLPPAQNISAARLVVPIVHGTDQAPALLGATLLGSAFEPEKPFDFKNLGEVIGTAVLPKQPAAADYSPPKQVSLDITRALKKLTTPGTSFHGFALRMIQDRPTDDGYTVRADLPAAAAIHLEIDVFSNP